MCSGHAGTLLKLTVAATFVIELPATALILAPWRPLRVIGAALQAFLQVGGTTCFDAPAPVHGPAELAWQRVVTVASKTKRGALGSLIGPRYWFLEAMVKAKCQVA